MAKHDLLTAREAASLARCSPRTIQRAAGSGELAVAMKVAGQTGALLFERQVVERYAQSRSTKAAA